MYYKTFLELNDLYILPTKIRNLFFNLYKSILDETEKSSSKLLLLKLGVKLIKMNFKNILKHKRGG